MTKKPSWGGSRQGSGRPAAVPGRKVKSIYVTKDEYKKVKEFIEKLRKESFLCQKS